MVNYTYNYEINLDWVLNKKATNIKSNRIKAVIIDYSYEKNNAPIIVITAEVSKELSDAIILNKNKALMILSINKYATTGPVYKEKYIRGEYLYFLTPDINYNKDLELPVSEDASQDSHRRLTIGLIQLDFINKNKLAINSVYRNASKTDIIVFNTRHLDLLLEPMHDIKFDQLLIPPTTSISKLVEYLDSIDSLYSSPMRLFYDIDNVLYIMSSSGKHIKTNNAVQGVMIRIVNPKNSDSLSQGVIKDKTNNTYIVDISAVNTKMSIDTAQSKSFNTIIGVDSNGEQQKVVLDVNNDPSISQNLIEFVSIKNMNKKELAIMKESIERNTYRLTISKQNIDSSIFNMNKTYFIDNFESYKYLNGNYIIDSKKEVFVNNDTGFVCSVSCVFKKL